MTDKNTGLDSETLETSERDMRESKGGVTRVAFESPYPDRENPFLAPRRGANTNAEGVGNTNDEIQLLGFANVGVQKAIFSINGMVVPIGEGGLESGIEVISIQPPSVLLQRNRQRWQASLEY